MYTLFVFLFSLSLFGYSADDETRWNGYYNTFAKIVGLDKLFVDQDLSKFTNYSATPLFKTRNYNILIAKLRNRDVEYEKTYGIFKQFDGSSENRIIGVTTSATGNAVISLDSSPLVDQVDSMLVSIINLSKFDSDNCRYNPNDCSYYEVSSCRDEPNAIRAEPFFLKKMFMESKDKDHFDNPYQYFRRKYCTISRRVEFSKNTKTYHPIKTGEKHVFEIYFDYE